MVFLAEGPSFSYRVPIEDAVGASDPVRQYPVAHCQVTGSPIVALVSASVPWDHPEDTGDYPNPVGYTVSLLTADGKVGNYHQRWVGDGQTTFFPFDIPGGAQKVYYMQGQTAVGMYFPSEWTNTWDSAPGVTFAEPPGDGVQLGAMVVPSAHLRTWEVGDDRRFSPFVDLNRNVGAEYPVYDRAPANPGDAVVVGHSQIDDVPVASPARMIVNVFSPAQNRILVVARDAEPQTVNSWHWRIFYHPYSSNSVVSLVSRYQDYVFYYYDVSSGVLKHLWTETFRDIVESPARPFYPDSVDNPTHGYYATGHLPYIPASFSGGSMSLGMGFQVAVDFSYANGVNGEPASTHAYEWDNREPLPTYSFTLTDEGLTVNETLDPYGWPSLPVAGVYLDGHSLTYPQDFADWPQITNEDFTVYNNWTYLYRNPPSGALYSPTSHQEMPALRITRNAITTFNYVFNGGAAPRLDLANPDFPQQADIVTSAQTNLGAAESVDVLQGAFDESKSPPEYVGDVVVHTADGGTRVVLRGDLEPLYASYVTRVPGAVEFEQRYFALSLHDANAWTGPSQTLVSNISFNYANGSQPPFSAGRDRTPVGGYVSQWMTRWQEGY